MSESNVLGPVLAALVVVAGWLVNHLLTLRAQQQNFRNQLVDRARMEVVRAIHAYQRWLGSFSVDLRLLHQPFLFIRMNLPPNWKGPHDEFSARLADRSATSDWSIALEEYEALFPETRQVRIELVLRQREFLTLLSDILGTLMTFMLTPAGSAVADQEARVKALQEKIPLLEDQAALLEDLRVHLQNVSLHEIAGTKVPERVPADPEVPKIVVGPDGQLVIRPYRDRPLPPGVTTRE